MSTVRPDTILANDFAAQWDEVREDALAAIDRVGSSGWLVLGAEVEAFERELGAWWGVEHAVGVASGLDAIEIALRCLGIGPGDRVLTTPLTAFATTLAIMRAGAVPIWSDVDESGSMDLAAADEVLAADPSIRAVVPVHLYGHPLDPAALRAMAERHAVVVVEDCAQSAGAARAGAPTGRAGVAAATSLYPTKNLGAMGDGGVLLTDDAELAERARRLRNYGQSERYRHVEPGLNSRLDELHAAVLRSALLPRLDGWLRRRAEVAERYVEALQDSPVLSAVRPTGGTSANHLFPVEVIEGEAERHAEALEAAGVSVGRHYPVLCPDQPACAGTGSTATALPTARRLAERELSLPLHPHLADADVERVIDACGSLAA
ncbi:MAG TPA: DegT/DnrJ/EryC1/StrS family aminotransferase [Thermoleophilaceae bacterium]|nr:DegT/DnrJ/EryC1/StrS family aminotransferase [Thermoleophilaceae bacterium]